MEDPEEETHLSADNVSNTSAVGITSNHPSYSFSTQALSSTLQKCKEFLGIPHHSVQIIATDENEIRKLNKEYRKKDSVTDVLSFSYLNLEPKPKVGLTYKTESKTETPELGDIFICMEKAAEQAAEIGQSISAEFLFLSIHGLLHVCGYDHENPEDEKEMIEQQKKLLDRLKESGSYPTQFIVTKGKNV